METSLSKFQPHVLSILWIIAGLLFLSSGLQKWFGFPVANPNFANTTLASMLGIAGLIEIIGGVLVTVGLYTRAAAFIMSGEMAVAYWYYAKPSGEGFYADTEWRHAGSAVLFRFPLLGVRWCRRMEPRRHAAKEGLADLAPRKRLLYSGTPILPR
jgi:putative oxidoreductase